MNLPKHAIITPSAPPEYIENNEEIPKEIPDEFDNKQLSKLLKESNKRILYLEKKLNNLEHIINADFYSNSYTFDKLVNACFSGDIFTFNYLIDEFTFKNVENGMFGNGMCINIDSQGNQSNLSNNIKLLINTCKGGNIDILDYLVKLGVNINQDGQNNFRGCMCLRYACQATQYKLVKYLLENGAIICDTEYSTSDSPDGLKIKNILLKYKSVNVRMGPVGKIVRF